MSTYDKNALLEGAGTGLKILQGAYPMFPTNQKKKENSTEQKPASMPVGGDIETEEDMELFLDGMRSEEQEKADRSARARLKYSARPEVRQGLIEYNEAQLKEKSRQGIFERVFAEEYKKDPEKAHLKAWEAAENAEYDKEEVERLKERIKELKFATDIENAGKIPAQIASEKAFAEAKASGHLSPAAVSMQRGDAVIGQYNELARRARNDLYYHNLNNQIAELEGVKGSDNYFKSVAIGEKVTPQKQFFEKNALGKELVNFINDQTYALGYSGGNRGKADAARFLKLTEDEKDVIRAYASMGDYATVEEYYKLLERDLNERVQNETNEAVRDFSYEHPFLAGVGNVASIVGSPTELFDEVQIIKNEITGEFVPIDRNAPVFALNNFGEQSKKGIAERVYDLTGGGLKGEIASYIAEKALSGARDMAVSKLGGVGKLLSATDTIGDAKREVIRQGGNLKDAWVKALVALLVDEIVQ